ncbi:MAG: hypothetical protein R2749_02770 [Acidimicrobiales bacterium]
MSFELSVVSPPAPAVDAAAAKKPVANFRDRRLATRPAASDQVRALSSTAPP